MNEFVKKKHDNNPDYLVEIRATGVITSPGRVNWLVDSLTHNDIGMLADALEYIVDAIRQGKIK